MTAEGRLARGKENKERGRFLTNSETMAATEKPQEKPVEKPKPVVKEKKDAK